LTDAIDTLNQTQRVFAHEFKGKRYDVGNKFGFVQTTIEYGLKHPEVKDELRKYILEVAQRLNKKVSKMTIAVLGGAGYIGSHTVAQLVKAGQDVVVLDNLITGHKRAVDP
jgi:pentose-5-phosphate-3-epimerase